MSMIETVLMCTLGALAMCYLLRAVRRSEEVGRDGRQLPDEMIWGFRDMERSSTPLPLDELSSAVAAMDLDITAHSVSWRTVELTDDLTLLATELRAHGERQNWMIRVQAARIVELTQALHYARSEREHFQRLYEEQQNRAPVATDGSPEVAERVIVQ